ncbi:MAG: hypothetical protein JXQ73_14585 [Phycisphaerae bacterium]|nr:hypothetical protein [Phycisphaerae bacterium]
MMRIPLIPVLVWLLSSATCAGENGRIGGTVTPVEKVTSITAVPRSLDVTCASCKRKFTARANAPGGTIKCKACGKSLPVPVYPAKIDKTTGLFEITGVPPGQRYDLIVETTSGRIEGVDLSPFESDLERLRKGPARVNPRAFSAEDREAVSDLITKAKQFENFVRCLYIAGHGDKATALVEKARVQDDKTGKFHSEKDSEAIWRVELWYFRKWFGGWERVSNVEGVLYRRRMPRGQYDAMNWIFVDKLGGIEVSDAGASRPVTIQIPSRLDPKLGRVAGAASR